MTAAKPLTLWEIINPHDRCLIEAGRALQIASAVMGEAGEAAA